MSVGIRPARALDAGALGAILHGFSAGTDWMPVLHTGAEAIAFCGRMIDRGWVSVALEDRKVLGFLAREGPRVHALYLRPEACGQGIGKALLDRAKGEAGPLELWTFQANERAQRFYLREGFVEGRRTDGAENDEGLPDIFYTWQPARAGKAAT